MYPKGNLLIPAPHGQLEAILKEPSVSRKGVALVCHPLPQGGGTMHNKVVFRAAAGLIDAGLATLRFNFRGVGQSTGEQPDIAGGIDDVKTAIDFLATEYPDEDITLAGFSFGSRTGMAAGSADERVERLISIGTPVDKYRDYDFLLEIRKPILFVHGDMDQFGSLENIKQLVQKMEKVTDAELVYFENCGHFFDRHLDQLRNAVREWTARKLSSNLQLSK